MKEVTYSEFNAFLGKHGWPPPKYDFNKRYQVTTYECIGIFDGVNGPTSMRKAEKHDSLKYGKVVSTSYMIPSA